MTATSVMACPDRFALYVIDNPDMRIAIPCSDSVWVASCIFLAPEFARRIASQVFIAKGRAGIFAARQ